MDDDKASRFISSLVKSIQALCNGFVDFSNSIEVVGHIHLNIDRTVKLDYVLTEEVSKSVSEGSTVFSSHSYHSQPPPSVSSKSASDTSNLSQKSRKENQTDPLGLSALPREVPNTSRSDVHSNRVSDNSNSSHSLSGNVGFSRTSESESLKLENNRSSCQLEDSSNKRRKMAPLSQTQSPAAKRSRTSDFGSGSRTVTKEPGFEVIEIKEEPDDEPAVFFGGSSGQDIQAPDFNVVMESLDQVNQLEQGSDLVGDGGGGDGMGGSQQPVFPVMFHQSDGMASSSSAGPVPGPSDPQAVASSGDALHVKTTEASDVEPPTSPSTSTPDKQPTSEGSQPTTTIDQKPVIIISSLTSTTPDYQTPSSSSSQGADTSTTSQQTQTSKQGMHLPTTSTQKQSPGGNQSTPLPTDQSLPAVTNTESMQHPSVTPDFQILTSSPSLQSSSSHGVQHFLTPPSSSGGSGQQTPTTPSGSGLSVPSLLASACSRPHVTVPSMSPKFKPEDLPPDTKAEDVARLTERHILERVPPTEKKKYPSKRCRVCLRRSGYNPGPMTARRKHPKESVYYCPQCPSKPGLCCYPCYYIYHSKLNYWEPDEGEEAGGSEGAGTSGGGSRGVRYCDDRGGLYGGMSSLDQVGHPHHPLVLGSGGLGLGLSSQTSQAIGQAMRLDSGTLYGGAVIEVDTAEEQKYCPVPMYGESVYGPGGQ